MASVIESWIPSFWGDEAASVISANRPLDSLLEMLGHVDAVHGVYYFALHAWVWSGRARDLADGSRH